MALWNRARAGHDLDGLVHHSDAGSQYTSIRYTERLAEAGALRLDRHASATRYDNALAESVIGLYKTECVRRDGPWRGVDDLELATLDWVDWFNTTRLHSSIGDVPPIEYEPDYYRQNTSPATASQENSASTEPGAVQAGVEPLLQGLVQALDLALRLGMVRAAVLLRDAELVQFDLERVGASTVAGGEHHSVVGQRRLRDAVVAQAVRNAATTVGPVTRGWAVTDR